MNPERHVEKFLEEVKGRDSAASFERKKTSLKYYLKFLRAQGKDTVHVGPDLVNRFRAHIFYERFYAREYAWSCVRSVKDFYEYLKERGVVEENPVQAYRFKRGILKTRVYSNEEILRAYIANWRNLYTSASRIETIQECWRKVRGVLDELDLRLQTLDQRQLEEIAAVLNRHPKKGGGILYRYGRVRCLWFLKGILRWMYNNGYRKDNPGGRFTYEFSPDTQETPPETPPYDPVWQAWSDKFVMDARVRWRPRTVETCRRYIKGFFKYLSQIKIQDIHQIKIDVLENYRALVYSEDRLADATKWSKVAVMRYFMNWLERTDQILSNPARRMSWPKRTRGLPTRLMSPHEVSVIMSAPDIRSPFGLRNKAVFELMYSTGMRVGEAGGVRIEDIDFENGWVRINNPKGGPSFQRVVPVGKIALGWVKKYMDEARYLFCPRDGCERLLFLSKTGGPVSALSVSSAMRHYCAKQGMRKHYSSHSWRVTCATMMLRNSADIRHVQEQLGHHCLDSTKIYTRLCPTDLKKVHEKTHPREREYRRIQPRNSP